MKKNIGTVDKTIRIFVAAILALLYFTDVIKGTLGIVLLVFAVVFVMTSVISFCPIYRFLGLSTGKK